MNLILVDTSVWSLALRKKLRTPEEDQIVAFLAEIIRDLRLVMIGPIRQEILSGISDVTVYENLRQKISIFPDFEMTVSDFELAASLSNECRREGIQGSHTDFLICSVAKNHNLSILTLDKDFAHYQRVIGIKLEAVQGP